MAKKVTKKDEGAKNIDELLKNINKKFGDEVEILSSEKASVEGIPTGSYNVDYVFGCGGVPRGRIIEISGQESSGKTSLSLFIAGHIQKNGGRAALIDAEFAYDPKYTASLGVDTENLVVFQPLTLESAMETIKDLAESNLFDIIILDSIAALSPRDESTGQFLKDTMALQARKMSTALRIITPAISRSKTTVIFINQIREKVGIVFGNPNTTPGGKAVKFYSSVRLEASKGEKLLGKDGEVIGNVLKMKTIKNKVGFSNRTAQIDLYYGKGVDTYLDALEFATKLGVIDHTGNTYSFSDEKLGVGTTNAKKFLEKNVDVFQKVKFAIDEKLLSLKNDQPESVEVDDEEEEDSDE